MLTARTVALLAVTFLFAQGSFALGLIPKKGHKVTFERTYGMDHLKNHPLQFTKKTSFTISNTNGMLTGTWNSTMRDPSTDEAVESEASSICRPLRRGKIECAFGNDAGTILLSPETSALRISIPAGQGVAFSVRTEDGMFPGEFLLGTDDDNNLFRLYAQKAKR